MRDSLNGVQFLNMKNDALVGARADEETAELEGLPQRQPTGLFGQSTKSHRLDAQFDLPGASCFSDFGLVIENKVNSGKTGWRVAQRAGLHNTRRQINMVHSNFSSCKQQTRTKGEAP